MTYLFVTSITKNDQCIYLYTKQQGYCFKPFYTFLQFKTCLVKEFSSPFFGNFWTFSLVVWIKKKTLTPQIEELDAPLPRMTYQWNGLTLLNTGDPIEVKIAINIIQITDLCILLYFASIIYVYIQGSFLWIDCN